MLKINSMCDKDTKNWGYKLGKLFTKGDVICLSGDLGAGKTSLTQGIAKGLGVDDYVTSPTYTLINEYKGRYPVYHFDVYRINDIDEVYELGYEEYLYSDGVIVIEWASIIKEILPENRLDINIKRGNDLNYREIYIEAKGKRYKEIINSLDLLVQKGDGIDENISS